jgi:DNA-binding NarL/FixJ family response regulator
MPRNEQNISGDLTSGPSLPKKRDRPLGTKKAVRPIRFVIADDHVLVRELIVHLLTSDLVPMESLAEVDSAERALAACQCVRPDILLVDLRILAPTGQATIAQLRKRTPSVRILLYSGGASDRDIVRAMQEGVDGFIGKNDTSHEFREAMYRIAQGANYFCSQSSRLLAEIAAGKHAKEETGSSLSPRERQILRLIADGQTSKEIAAVLGLSVATIDTHRRNAMAKIGARNVADLIRYGHDHGLLAHAENTA